MVVAAAARPEFGEGAAGREELEAFGVGEGYLAGVRPVAVAESEVRFTG